MHHRRHRIGCWPGTARAAAEESARPRESACEALRLPLALLLWLALRLNVTVDTWKEREGGDATEARAEEY